MIFICYRVTPGLCRPTSVTRRSDTGVLLPMPGQNCGVSGRTGATPEMYRRKP